MSSSEKKQRLFAGWAAVALGIFGIAMMVRHPEGLHAPAWVAYAAMSTFILAGGGILLGEHGAKRLGEWVGLAAVAGLFVTAAWVSFGPGPRNCTALLFFVSTSASAWLCRGAFGIGSLLVLLIFFLMVRRLRG